MESQASQKSRPEPGDLDPDRLRMRCHGLGLSEADLARLVGAQRALVNKWCAGAVHPGWRYMRRLAIALRCTIDDLIVPFPPTTPSGLFRPASDPADEGREP